MAVRRALTSLGKALLVALVMVPLGAIWLSGRFAGDAGPEPQPGAPGALGTLPRSEATTAPPTRPPPGADVQPIPAPTVTVGKGAVPAPPAVAGAAPVPPPRAGQLQGEPQGLPDPNRSEAQPR